MTGDETVMVYMWIKEMLSASDEVTDIVEDRIFFDKAPAICDYPFIVVQCQDASDVRGVGSTNIFASTLFVVKALIESDRWSPLRPVARAIDKALTITGAYTFPGYGDISGSVREQGFQMTEDVNGQTIRHLGGIYRIQAQGV